MEKSFFGISSIGMEYSTDILKKLDSVPKNIDLMKNAKSGQTPKEVIYEKNKLKLYRYKSLTENQYNIPVLLVYSLINKPYILDLQPNRSIVRKLLKNNFDVYLVDWGDPSILDKTLKIDDYVNWYLNKCVDIIRKRNNVEKINILGYCMGGTLSAIFSSIYPKKVENLVLLAAGLDFEKSNGILSQWSKEKYFDEGDIPKMYNGNVPAEFLDMGFVLMEPINNLFTKYYHLYDNFDDEEFVKLFARMEKWLRDGVDLAGETYKQFINDLYQHNKFTKNQLYLDGKLADINNINMPVLQIVGSKDHLVPPETSKPFNEKIPSNNTEIYELESGHVGLSMSSKAHNELWPKVSRWLEDNL